MTNNQATELFNNIYELEEKLAKQTELLYFQGHSDHTDCDSPIINIAELADDKPQYGPDVYLELSEASLSAKSALALGEWLVHAFKGETK